MDILKKIYQDFKTYYKNEHELLKKIRDIYYGAPQDVTLQWEDPDTGNIENLSIPSYSKLRDRFMSDVNSAMGKTVYVDAENGSDTSGDGTQGAPFKTIRKAIDSVPTGGKAAISLISDITVEGTISISRKYIRIVGNTSGKKITVKNNRGYGFQLLHDTVLEIHPSIDEIIWIPGTVNVQHWNTLFKSFEGNNTLILNHWHPSHRLKITIQPNNDSKSGHIINNEAGFLTIYMDKVDFIIPDTSKYAICFDNIACQMGSISYKKPDGTELQQSDVIKCITKDSNGVPRNIISNIVF